MIISITNITFGYRLGCSISGISSCVNTTCCREETGDCFTPYNQTLLSQLQQYCKERSRCTFNSNNGLNEISSYCFNGIPIFHSYSKIEYQCVINNPSSTPQSTYGTTQSSTKPKPITETSTLSTVSIKFSSNTLTSTQASTSLTNIPATGGIVGGIIGVILVIGIVAAIIFFIKRRNADKKPPKNVHINQNGSNRRYKTGTTVPRTNAIPVYYELEKSTNNTSSAKTTSSDNYDYIVGDNNVKNSTGKDNYSHIGISGVMSDDEYNHLKGTNSNKPSAPDSNYNHIGSFSTAEDNYQHIGDKKSRIITDDAYNHIDGRDNTGLDNDDYHHIGGSHEHQVVTDGTYNHIGGDLNEILGNDDYHHIGNVNTQPIITDGEYSHIGGADA
ncbi:hypothetical protein SNE40_020632 [Patella caerulea]|uniref:Uncharacterized protein n=1 Tax=Patella caerulea TaxID=87958 RepID=A0AAN8J517_PATCE